MYSDYYYYKKVYLITFPYYKIRYFNNRATVLEYNI